jgi:hypothetical protein
LSSLAAISQALFETLNLTSAMHKVLEILVRHHSASSPTPLNAR